MAYKVNIGATEMSGNLTVNSDYAYYGDGSNLSGISSDSVDVTGSNKSFAMGIVVAGGLSTSGVGVAVPTTDNEGTTIGNATLTFNPNSGVLSGSGQVQAASVDVDGALDAGGAIEGGSLTDGTATLTGGALSGVTTLALNGTITGGTSYSGSAGLSGSSLVVGLGNVMLSRDGTIGSAGAAVLDTGGVGSSFAGELDIGGGYGSTGITLSAAGVITANGAITSDGAVTGGSLTDGTLSISSGAITGGTSYSGSTTIQGASISVDGAVTGGSLTDGTLSISSGAITGGTSYSGSAGLSGSSLVIGLGNVMLSRDGTVDIAGTLNADGLLDIGNGVRYGSLSVKTSAATLTSANSIIVASGSSAFNITLPGNPTEGEFFMIKRHANMSAGDVTILSASAANGASIDGDSSVVLETVGAAVSLVYDDTTDSWNVF